MILILNYLHRIGFRSLLNAVSSVAYFLKGFGFVKSVYHPAFRAYEYKVRGTTFLCPGPGWAYSIEYLSNMLRDTFCYYYFPKQGDCVIDLGAGLGEETIILTRQVGPRGKVFSIEANLATFKALNYVCTQNNFSWAKPINLALYNKNEMVTIEDDEENYLGNTIKDASHSKKTFTVMGQTFDSFVKSNNIDRIDFLKVNIEGAEQFLIGHMNESSGIIKNICISCHDFRHTDHNHGEFYVTREKVKAYLLELGFEITFRKTGNSLVDNYLYAWRTT